MVREASHPNREVFRDTGELYRFLAEALTEPERDRLRALLWGQGPASSLASSGPEKSC